MMEGATSEAKWAVRWGECLLLFLGGEKAAKLGGGSEPPTPPRVSQAPSEHPELGSLAWHSRG